MTRAAFRGKVAFWLASYGHASDVLDKPEFKHALKCKDVRGILDQLEGENDYQNLLTNEARLELFMVAR